MLVIYSVVLGGVTLCTSSLGPSSARLTRYYSGRSNCPSCAPTKQKVTMSVLFKTALCVAVATAAAGMILTLGGPPCSILLDGEPRFAALLATTPTRDRKAAKPLQRRHMSAWWAEMQDESITPDKEWVKFMRVPRSVFYAVLAQIQDHAVFSVPDNVGARTVPVAKQFAAFLLRVGANEPVHAVRRSLAISEGMVTTSVRRVAQAINDVLGYQVCMPLNGTRRKAAVKDMFVRRQFPGAVGIIDCTHMEISVPTDARRSGNIAPYYDRKGRPTLTFQCITTPEARPRFLSVCGGIPGSAYDTKLLERSDLYQNLKDYLEADEYLAGDCGYALRPWMMRGWANNELTDGSFISKWRQKCNKFYSGMRISVERAFGILKARFRSLGGRLVMRKVVDYRQCFKACCILHNICAEYKSVSVTIW